MFKSKKVDVLLPIETAELIESKVRSYSKSLYENARSNPRLALTLEYKIDIYKTNLVKEAMYKDMSNYNYDNQFVYGGCSI